MKEGFRSCSAAVPHASSLSEHLKKNRIITVLLFLWQLKWSQAVFSLQMERLGTLGTNLGTLTFRRV